MYTNRVETLTGSVAAIVYHNPENGYTVFRLDVERPRRVPYLNASGEVTVTGHLPELHPGEYLRLKGDWLKHPQHGYQFRVECCELSLPVSVDGIRRYLGSGLIVGIGRRLAERIVNYFGEQTLEIIENQPARLREVPDIGPKRSRQIAQAWEKQRAIKEVMLFLHTHGVNTSLAVKIYKTYGDEAIARVQSDPYQLAWDVRGVGFKTADKIAKKLGLSHEHPSRVEAGLIYILNEMSRQGHVYVPQEELAHRASTLLDVSRELIPPALTRLLEKELLATEALPLPWARTPANGPGGDSRSSGAERSPVFYLPPFFHSEKAIARRLSDLALALPSHLSDIPPDFVSLDPDLSPEQRAAIRTALTHPVSVLTGGPGTGKTTAIRNLIAILEAQNKAYALASPTGRAAKRLSEAVGRPASTIHRLLKYSPAKGFQYDEAHPLPVDCLVVDEASMLDLVLAHHLVKALHPGTHLLLVGDVDQLPSVGAGDVLRDVIRSGIAPVTRLTEIFRQAADSHIITNAHRIHQGKMPVFSPARSPGSADGDFFLFPAEDAEQAADWVVKVTTERIPRAFGFDPLTDIQVLSPMYRGLAGVQNLNERLQEVLNPPHPQKPEKLLFGTRFRAGDKVMQTQNNYDKEVFNGTIGRIHQVDLANHELWVEMDGDMVVYDFVEADQLVLAYAVTVHKSQGSEFPVVVMPLVTSQYLMLQRNLLYTAVTRARELCVLVGSRRAIAMAVRNNKVQRRYSALDWRLAKAKP